MNMKNMSATELVEDILVEYTYSRVDSSKPYSPIDTVELFADMRVESSRILISRLRKKQCTPAQYHEAKHVLDATLLEIFQDILK